MYLRQKEYSLSLYHYYMCYLEVFFLNYIFLVPPALVYLKLPEVRRSERQVNIMIIYLPNIIKAPSHIASYINTHS